MTIRDRIHARVIALCRVPELPADVDIFERGLLSSLYALRLVQALEREFGIEIGDDDLSVKNFRTIEAMTQLIARLVPAA